MMKLKRVGEPEPSPDGKWVLFSVVDVDLAANKKTPHIWIVPLNAGAAASAPRLSTSSSPIRTAIARAGLRMESGLRLFLIKKEARKFGSRSSMAHQEP